MTRWKKEEIERFSQAVSLTVFEIQRHKDLIPAYMLANMMSPQLWKWREKRKAIGQNGQLLSIKTRLRDLQRQFHGYEFTNQEDCPGGDPWGLLSFAEEEQRLGREFMQRVRQEYDDTLRFLLKENPESQFGVIVYTDYYQDGFFPRLRNETLEVMNAYGLTDRGKGSGKCVALALLWAASLPICSRFRLDNIMLIANRAHLFVVLDLGFEGIHLFNNGKWYSEKRIANESQLAETAKTVSTATDVLFA